MTKETDARDAQIEELTRNLRAAQRVANKQAGQITNLEFENARLSELVQEKEIALAQMKAGDAEPGPEAEAPKPNRRQRRAAAAKKDS